MSVLRQSESIRVLTVDDHQLLREGIAAVIESQEDMTLVAQASNGREAVESFRRLRPDVTLMDLRMPDMSGIEAITRDPQRVSRCSHRRADHIRG